MYQERTRSIQISVEPFYVDEQSAPEQNRFVFGYRIQIDNQGVETKRFHVRDGIARSRIRARKRFSCSVGSG